MANDKLLKFDWWKKKAAYLFFFAVLPTSYSASLSEERASQKVTIKLYDLSTSEWSSSKKRTFSSVMANEANTYCTLYPTECGFTVRSKFDSDDVGLFQAKRSSQSIQFSFYIQYPNGSSLLSLFATENVLRKSIVEAIASNARSEVKDNVGHYITYIEDEYYSIPPSKELNEIVIPIACITVVLLAISTIIMNYQRTLKTRQKLIENRRSRKANTKSVANDLSYNAMDTTTTSILTTNLPASPRSDLFSNNNTTSPRKLATKLSSSEWKDEKEGPVILGKKQTVAKIFPTGLNHACPTSMNLFHSGNAAGEEGDDGEVEVSHKNINYPVLAKPRLTIEGHQEQQQQSMDVAESLAEDEAKRERKRRRKERRREKKRRDEEENNELEEMKHHQIRQYYDYENKGYYDQ